MTGDKVTERQLLTELERGDDSHLKPFFSGEFEEKRLASIRLLREMFSADVKSGHAKPESLYFSASHWYSQRIEVQRDGNTIYLDVLDTAKLTHRDPGDVVPQNRRLLRYARNRAGD